VARLARRPRAYVAVRGGDAEDLLQRMLSNDVSADWCEALLLTPKARVIAPVSVWRRGPDDFLLLTEPDLGPVVREQLLRMRFRSRCEIELEEHVSTIAFGEDGGIPNRDYSEPAVELLDDPREPTMGDDELELLRILARTPRFGREIDGRVLPAEAGLEERAISFTKGCYPGQEPVARLHYRGHANRGLRVLELDELPEPETEVVYEGKPVGRVTSAARRDGGALALAYVRAEVPDDAELAVGALTARPLDPDDPLSPRPPG
jgi:tRNA-modifying protein YgfZ